MAARVLRSPGGSLNEGGNLDARRPESDRLAALGLGLLQSQGTVQGSAAPRPPRLAGDAAGNDIDSLGLAIAEFGVK